MGQILLASEIVPERVEWLWPGYLPRGKVVVLDGDPGLGKSTLLCEIAARVTQGQPLPNGRAAPPANVLMLAVEDGQSDTTVPRLIAAGADLGRVALRETYTDEEGGDTLPAFPGDTPALHADVQLLGAKLVVIDPIMRCLADDVNAHSDQQLGRALMPLRRLAEAEGCTIVLVRHLNKSTNQSALHRGQGGMAFVGVARVALLMARDPQDETRRILTVNKTNFTPAPSLAFRLVSGPLDAARLEWLGTSVHTAESVLATEKTTSEEKANLVEAKGFLRELLADGPVLATEVQKQAREFGLTAYTLGEAKKALGIKPDKAREQRGRWAWALPQPGEGEEFDLSPTFKSSTSSHSSHSSHSSPLYKTNNNSIYTNGISQSEEIEELEDLEEIELRGG